MVVIEDHESLERWLEGRSQDDAVAIAGRSGMRATPSLAVLFEGDRVNDPRALLSPFLHAVLISSVARKWPTQEIITAARSADSAAFSAAELSADSAHFAVDELSAAFATASAADSAASSDASAVRSAAIAAADLAADSAAISAFLTVDSAARPAAYSALSNDCNRLADGVSPAALLESPLWPSGPPEGVKEDWERLDAIFADDPAFAFWRRWYHGALDGKPVNWEVQRDVALIPTDIWEAGPDRVADEIARIEAEHAAPDAPPANPASLRQQVEFLLDNAEANEVAARSLAGLIEATSREFRSKCNDIPDEVLTIERLPSLLHRLGDLMEEGADEIEALMKVIDDLRRENAVLRSQLATRDRRTDAGPLRVRVDPASWKTVARDKLIAGTVGALVGSALTMGGQFLSHVETPAERAALAHLAKTAIIDEGERR